MSDASHDVAAWSALQRRIIACKRCPRLREYCEHIALKKRASFRAWDYWSKPVPNFGDEKGIAETLKLANLNVPVLVQAYPDDLVQQIFRS